jgi:putative hydrolase
MPRPDINAFIADELAQAALLLEQQGADVFRAGAYRRAADTVRRHPYGLDRLFAEQGIQGLVSLPGIGRGIGAAIVELIRTGRFSKLERLRGELEPVRLFQTVPGIGPTLAQLIHDELHVDTLEGLELAAHDGRLERMTGFGARRAASIRASLGAILGRHPRFHRISGVEPGVELILNIDRRYREGAERGEWPTIAPKRFNPRAESWLPVMHASRDEWHFTLLFSNTSRAHHLQHTRDWVVVYFYDHEHDEGQCTVVTEYRGPLAGKRVIRGRERECRELYDRLTESDARQSQSGT